MNFRERHRIPDLGIGVGARTKHYPVLFGDAPHTQSLDGIAAEGQGAPAIDWLEVISENFMVAGGRPLANLDRLRETRRVVTHGVSLSIGAASPLDVDYLKRLKAVVERVDAPFFTDHLCWTGIAGVDVHDLLPLPYTEEALAFIAERIRRVQEFVGRPFGLENASSYLSFTSSEMPEWEFLSRLAEKADCGILLDCNNVYVSARNHGFDPGAYIDAVPADRVIQMHLAGHTDKGGYLLDTHSDHVCEEVWALYRQAIRRTGPVSTLVEWDESIPEWPVLEAEAALARRARTEALSNSAVLSRGASTGHVAAASPRLHEKSAP